MKAIITRFHGPGNVRGSRIVASDGDGNRVSVSCRDDLTFDRNHEEAARALCSKMKWEGVLLRGTLMKGGRDFGQVWVWKQGNVLTGEEIRVPKGGE